MPIACGRPGSGQASYRLEADVGREVAPRAEAADVADEGDEGGGSQDADARHTQQVEDRGHLLSEARQFVVHSLGLFVEDRDFLKELRERVPQERGERLLGEGDPCVGQHLGRADRDGDAGFAEVATQGIDAGGAGAEVALPEAMEE